jgi:hypothetical protein
MNRRYFCQLLPGFLVAASSKDLKCLFLQRSSDPSKWHELYYAALMETNPRKMQVRINAAGRTMFQRYIYLTQEQDLTFERHIVSDALLVVETLSMDECGSQSHLWLRAEVKRAGMNQVFIPFNGGRAFPVWWS